MIPIADLRRFVKSCDPSAPVGPTDPFYVDLDAGDPVRGEAGQSCVGQMLRTLQLAEPTGETFQLFTGFRGSGKTTELKRLAHLLEADPDVSTRVVYVDFYDFLDLHAPVDIADLLRVVAWRLDREAAVAEGADPDAARGYLDRFVSLLRSEVELKGVDLSAGAAGVMLELRDNPTFKEKVTAALQGRFQQFARDAAQSMRESVIRIRKHARAERVVLIADSLEKISPVFEHTREAVERSVESVFLHHARFLQLPCHAVYTFPAWLRFRTAGLGTMFVAEPILLPMVRVAGPDGVPYAPGLAKLTELVARRIDLAAVFGPHAEAALRPIVEASGGYPRDLLRMVRELLVHAQAFPVGEAHVARVINRLAEDYAEVIRATDLDLLLAVARTHAVPLGTAAEVQAFGDLVERWLVLTYRNGHRWYDLHPLVRRAPVVASRLAAGADGG